MRRDLCNMIDWDDLRFLRAVGQSGSVSAAARVMAVDKATVSRRIAGLEHALGMRVLDRRASGWRFTAAGARFAALAEGFEGQLAELAADLAGEGGLRARVRFSAPQWFCNSVLLPHLRELRAKAAWLDLDINPTSRVLNLAERETEVALRNLLPAKGEYVIRRAGELGSAFYASRRFVAERGPFDDVKAWDGVAVVGHPDKLTYLPEFDWFNAMQGRWGPILRVGDAETMVQAVAGDLGVAVLPCLLGERHPGLQRLFPPVARQTIWLVAPIDVGRTRPVHLVLDFVAGIFRRNATALAGVGLS